MTTTIRSLNEYSSGEKLDAHISNYTTISCQRKINITPVLSDIVFTSAVETLATVRKFAHHCYHDRHHRHQQHYWLSHPRCHAHVAPTGPFILAKK